MKQKVNLILVPMAALLMNIAHAKEGGVGNGWNGEAHVCAKGGQINTIEMYDLFEGHDRYRYQGNLPTSTTLDEVLGEIYRRATEISPEFGTVLEKEVNNVRAKIVSVSKLYGADDSHKVVGEEGCDDLPFANWDKRADLIQVNSSYLDFLTKKKDFVQIAALYTHEAIYHLYRSELNQTDSDDARQLNAKLFYHQSIAANDPLILSIAKTEGKKVKDKLILDEDHASSGIRYLNYIYNPTKAAVFTVKANQESLVSFSIFIGTEIQSSVDLKYGESTQIQFLPNMTVSMVAVSLRSQGGMTLTTPTGEEISIKGDSQMPVITSITNFQK